MRPRLGRPRRLGRVAVWWPPAALNLLPLTVMQLALVCFFIQLAQSKGECLCHIRLLDRIEPPTISHGTELISEPMILVAPGEVWFEGLVDPQEIEGRLASSKGNHALLHPGEPFDGHVGLYVDRDVPWVEVAPLIAIVERQGYDKVDVVVVEDPPLPVVD